LAPIHTLFMYRITREEYPRINYPILGEVRWRFSINFYPNKSIYLRKFIEVNSFIATASQ
ncbi:MAG: hypothetical protein AB4290_30940, partial [Spirulina sp.]